MACVEQNLLRAVRSAEASHTAAVPRDKKQAQQKLEVFLVVRRAGEGSNHMFSVKTKTPTEVKASLGSLIEVEINKCSSTNNN